MERPNPHSLTIALSDAQGEQFASYLLEYKNTSNAYEAFDAAIQGVIDLYLEKRLGLTPTASLPIPSAAPQKAS